MCNNLLTFFISLSMLMGCLPREVACQNNSQTQPFNYLKEDVSQLENSLLYFYSLVERIPDSSFHYRPSPEIMSTREQILHVLNNLVYLSNFYFGYAAREELIGSLYSKDELLSILQNLSQTLPSHLLSLPEETFLKPQSFRDFQLSGHQILNLMKDHIAHHRGQIIVYIRLLELQPPPYIGW
jgi:uncharacterized damage-inducible protein DinB